MKIYQHYKGDLYELIEPRAKDQDGRLMCVYRPLYHDAAAPMFVRPYVEFCGDVEVDGKRVPRFRPVDMKEFLK